MTQHVQPMGTRMRLVVTLLCMAVLPMPVLAQDLSPAEPIETPQSGVYESYSPVQMRPVVPTTSEAAAAHLPQWFEVAADGNRATLTIQPEGRVEWQLVYGPHGPVSKHVSVDRAKAGRVCPTVSLDVVGQSVRRGGVD